LAPFFPSDEKLQEDLIFELTIEGLANLRHQPGTSNWRGTRYKSMASPEKPRKKIGFVVKEKQRGYGRLKS
jgi:hypothetical protein